MKKPTWPAIGLQLSCNCSFGTSERQRLDLAVPQRAEEGPLVACVPGGWWHGRHEDLRGLVVQLAERGYAAASIGHRLFDEVPNGLPMRNDLLDGCRRALEEAALHGQDCNGVLLLGSGSGSLPALLGGAFLADQVPVHGICLVGPPPGVQSWDGCPEKWRKQLERFHSGERDLDPCGLDLHQPPPLLICHGEDDDAVPLSAVQAWAKELRTIGWHTTERYLRHAQQDCLERAASAPAEQVLDALTAWIGEIRSSRSGEPTIGEPDFIQKLDKQRACER